MWGFQLENKSSFKCYNAFVFKVNISVSWWGCNVGQHPPHHAGCSCTLRCDTLADFSTLCLFKSWEIWLLDAAAWSLSLCSKDMQHGPESMNGCWCRACMQWCCTKWSRNEVGAPNLMRSIFFFRRPSSIFERFFHLRSEKMAAIPSSGSLVATHDYYRSKFNPQKWILGVF